MSTATFLKLLIGLILGISSLIQLIRVETWWFIQNVNLIFHEAGHIIFGLFGNFLGLIGGSLLEALIPLIVTIHFYNQKHFFSTAFGCWWLSTALLSISIYAGDAEARALPLITRDISTHDWYNILSQIGLLKYDHLFGFFFWVTSAFSIGFLFYFLLKDPSIKNLLDKHFNGIQQGQVSKSDNLF
jgi:hypothetical protein